MRHIRHNTFDDAAWEQARDMNPSVKELITEGDAKHLGFQEVLADVFNLAHQSYPVWQSPKEPTVQELLLQETSETLEFKQLRALSQGDLANASLATGVVGRKLRPRMSDAFEDHMAMQEDTLDVLENARIDFDTLDEAAAKTIPTDNTPFTAEQEALLEEMEAAGQRLADAQGVVNAWAASPVPANLKAEIDKARRDSREAATEAIATINEIMEAEQSLGLGSADAASNMQRVTVEEKLRLAKKLKESPKIKQLAEISGRTRLTALKKKASVVKELKQEVVGITVGDDLSRLVPSEIMYLADPQLEDIFFRKMMDEQLLIYDKEGEEPLGSGPILICVDGSQSMTEKAYGAITKEVWSKSIMLGLMAICDHEKRDLYVCQFAERGTLRTWEFAYRTAPEKITRVTIMDALETFISGGTDFETPLLWAAGIIEKSDDLKYRPADVMLITDGQAGFSDAFLKRWRDLQEKFKFHTYGVLIGQEVYGQVLRTAIDNVIAVQNLVTQEDAVTDLLFAH